MVVLGSVAMAFAECPHCYTPVLPSASGQCPACGKNTKDACLSSALVRTKITVREGVRLPAICYNCGQSTDRTRTISRGWQSAGDSGIVQVVALIAMIFAPFWALLWWLGRGQRPSSIRVRLPECVACSRASTSNIEHTDFGAGEITLVIHKDFRAAMAARTPTPTR